MLIPDVNILVNAFRPESSHHEICLDWLQRNLIGGETVGFLDLVCSGFVRITTNPRIFKSPATIEQALAFVDALLSPEAAELIEGNSRWWPDFRSLCIDANAHGNLITDAHIAAAAKSVNGVIISLDSDFNKFPSIRWRKPD